MVENDKLFNAVGKAVVELYTNEVQLLTSL